MPIAYWEYGLDRELILREKFAYLVAIYEQEIARPKLWWCRSLKGLSEKYFIDDETFIYGLRALKKLDLIEVRHSRVKPGDVENYKDRDSNEYRLKELISPREKQRQWKDLEKKYGVEVTGEAREIAGMIDEGNNVLAVYDFIRLFDWYGQKNVRMRLRRCLNLGQIIL